MLVHVCQTQPSAAGAIDPQGEVDLRRATACARPEATKLARSAQSENILRSDHKSLANDLRMKYHRGRNPVTSALHVRGSVQTQAFATHFEQTARLDTNPVLTINAKEMHL
jgi:hypothetical protein